MELTHFRRTRLKHNSIYNIILNNCSDILARNNLFCDTDSMKSINMATHNKTNRMTNLFVR